MYLLSCVGLHRLFQRRTYNNLNTFQSLESVVYADHYDLRLDIARYLILWGLIFRLKSLNCLQ